MTGAMGSPQAERSAPGHASTLLDSPALLKPLHPDASLEPVLPCLSLLGSPGGDATMPYEHPGMLVPGSRPCNLDATLPYCRNLPRPSAVAQLPASPSALLFSPSSQTQLFGPPSPIITHVPSPTTHVPPTGSDAPLSSEGTRSSPASTAAASMQPHARPPPSPVLHPPHSTVSNATGDSRQAPPLARKRTLNRRRSPTTPTRSTPSAQAPPPWCPEGGPAGPSWLEDEASRATAAARPQQSGIDLGIAASPRSCVQAHDAADAATRAAFLELAEVDASRTAGASAAATGTPIRLGFQGAFAGGLWPATPPPAAGAAVAAAAAGPAAAGSPCPASTALPLALQAAQGSGGAQATYTPALHPWCSWGQRPPRSSASASPGPGPCPAGLSPAPPAAHALLTRAEDAATPARTARMSAVTGTRAHDNSSAYMAAGRAGMQSAQGSVRAPPQPFTPQADSFAAPQQQQQQQQQQSGSRQPGLSPRSLRRPNPFPATHLTARKRLRFDAHGGSDGGRGAGGDGTPSAQTRSGARLGAGRDVHNQQLRRSLLSRLEEAGREGRPGAGASGRQGQGGLLGRLEQAATGRWGADNGNRVGGARSLLSQLEQAEDEDRGGVAAAACSRRKESRREEDDMEADAPPGLPLSLLRTRPFFSVMAASPSSPACPGRTPTTAATPPARSIARQQQQQQQLLQPSPGHGVRWFGGMGDARHGTWDVGTGQEAAEAEAEAEEGPEGAAILAERGQGRPELRLHSPSQASLLGSFYGCTGKGL